MNYSVLIAYDICEDEPTLDYIESEMAKEGVTQEVHLLIDLDWVLVIQFHFAAYRRNSSFYWKTDAGRS